MRKSIVERFILIIFRLVSKTKLMCNLLLFSCLLSSVFAVATPSLTFQGRILKADGTPYVSSSVQFKVQLRTPDANNCIMYEETQTLNLTGSDGLFTLSLNDGSGTRTDSSGIGFQNSFSNYKAFSINSVLCSAGSGTITYTPLANDERAVQIFFKDASMNSWEAMPSTTLTHAGYALEARQVGGFTPQSLVRVEDPVLGPQTVASLTPANFTSLTNLINGTSSQFRFRGGTQYWYHQE